MKSGMKAGWSLTGAFMICAGLAAGGLMLPGVGFLSNAPAPINVEENIMASANLYPASKPYNEGFLKVDGTHSLFYQEFGNPNGIPVVYLHGGPGGGSPGYAHQFFDPAVFRVIVYDQRGAGKSTPFGETKDNSPDILVEDNEKLRVHLGIDKWHVWGGSWGSTLSLLYSEAHPDRVLSMTLRGIFLGRQKELDFLYKPNGADQVFPEEFAKLRDFIPPAEQDDLLRAYYNRIAAGDKEAARRWSIYEGSISKLDPLPADKLAEEDDVHLVGMALMETHFFVNHPFQPDNRILDNIDRIKHIPTMIVQGRYDTVCPPISAWELHNAMPGSHLEMVRSGHSASEDEIQRVFIESSNRIRDLGSPVPPPALNTPQLAP